MASVSPRCPMNSFVYNATLCACNPGFLYNATGNGCSLFRVAGGEQVLVDSGVDYSITFPETIFSFESIKKFTQSQAVFLEATLFLLVSWLLFCFFVRFGKLSDGRSIWFRIRWWISRLDVCFATRHWLDDQKVVRKRKTELGGTLSIASWILFIGLFAALLYQIISKRTVEVHNVKATNAPDLASFINDMEFNITTISSMSCSNLRGLGTLVIGNPGFVDHRITSLSTFANYSCHNTTKGPIINLKCNNCQIFRDSAHISWQFIDLPNDPAMAVGFQFNLSAKNHANKKHISNVSGTLKNGSSSNDQPITFRGVEGNVLKFNLFPRIYRNRHDLKLIQPLFHEFLPGSSFNEITQLQDSLQNSNDGLINTTLYINFLSAYIVEIDNQNILGPVSFLADLGGLYCISIGIFFYLMVQCEYRIKKLRNEDSVMRRIRSRRKAQERWDKLRKYVRYTWGCSAMDNEYKIVERDLCCTGGMTGSSRKTGSSHKRAQQSRMHTISFNKKGNSPSEKISQKATPGLSDCQGTKSAPSTEVRKAFSELNHTQGAKSALNLERRFSCSGVEPVLKSEAIGDIKEGRHEHPVGSLGGDVSLPQSLPTANDYTIPPPPSLELKAGSEVNISDIQKNLQALYEYNIMLREKLVTAQSMLDDLTTKGSTSAMDSHI